MITLLFLEPALGATVLNTSLVDELISAAGVFDSVLPLKVELMALLMDAFEFLGGLVEFDLGGLSLSDLLLELLSLAGHLDCQLLDL